MGSLVKIGVFVLALIVCLCQNYVDACGACISSPMHGGWGSWQPAEPTCSNGYKTRYRNCDNPSPAHGGHHCSGRNFQSMDCNECNIANGGCEHKCINYPGYYTCSCFPGYKTASYWKNCDRYNDTHYETEIDECESSPCVNNGTCIDLTPGYKCKCLDQFVGENCENFTDPCLSTPCQNGGTCRSDNGTASFNCSCKTGFTGHTCEENIDDCASGPCMPNSYCKDLVNGYSCECYPSHTGDKCEIFLGSNFDLVFKRKSLDDMVLLSDGKGIPSMRFFTIALFVRANSRYNSGTLFSYSVPGKTVSDDIIVLSFTESQVQMQIKDEVVTADFKLADDHWHYIGVVWNGLTGNVSVYIDRDEIKRERNVKFGDAIKGSGWIALGQRYLAGEAVPALSTAFVGTLHQVSLWDVPATANHMWNAAHNCTWPIAGSVRAWSNFLTGIKGQVKKRFMTQCKALDMCTNNCSHFLHCESRQGRYYCKCQAGFTGPHCDINIDECSSNPCINGKCLDDVNRYDCECNEGYWGTDCEKKIINEGVCPELKKPRNGKISCRKVSGKKLCTVFCDEGYSFSSEVVTMYGCGPDTNWKWNDLEDLVTPTCSSKAAPKEIEHRFSIRFPGMQCKTIQSHNDLHSAVEKEIKDTLSTVPGCYACLLKEVTVPGCESPMSTKKRRAMDHALQILFSLVVKEGADSSSLKDNVEEKSEAVLFLIKYAVAMGQFRISLHGMNSTADRSSFQHLFSNIKCSAGFVTSGDGKGCVACPVGTMYDEKSFNCKPCFNSSYQDKEGHRSCLKCDEGKSTKSSGAVSSTYCVEDTFSTAASRENDNAVVIIVGLMASTVLAIASVVVFANCRRCSSCGFYKQRSNSDLHRYKPV